LCVRTTRPTHTFLTNDASAFQSEAKELGIGKSTLHYLRKNASNVDGFKVREKVRNRLIRS